MRTIYTDRERGDFRSTGCVDTGFELVIAEGPDGGVLHGRDSAARGWREWLAAWDGYRAHATSIERSTTSACSSWER